jgi:hypothetical protein
MALSNAEKQARYRERHLGVDGTKRRVTLYIGAAAKGRIDRLAHRKGYSMTALIEEWAAARHVETVGQGSQDVLRRRIGLSHQRRALFCHGAHSYAVTRTLPSSRVSGESRMGAARDLFREVGWPVRGKPEAYETLCRAAELWRADGQPFSAGMAMLRAVDAAWGRPEIMLDAHRDALRDFERVIVEQSPDTPAAFAALFKLWQTLNRALWLFEEEDRETVRSRIRELESELSQRLHTHFKNSEHADNYLVSAIVIVTNLDGQWSVQFPQHEVDVNSEQQLVEEVILNIPSAFHLFVFGRDWSGANEIVKIRKDAFTTPGLIGWRAVTLANVTPAEAMMHFDKAADAFAADTQPDAQELMRRGASGRARTSSCGQNTFGREPD